MQISFERGDFCENFSASIPFLFTSESTIWIGSVVENEVIRKGKDKGFSSTRRKVGCKTEK